MGKAKRQARKHSNHHDSPATTRRSKINRIQSSRAKPLSHAQVNNSSSNPKAAKAQAHPKPRPKVPFSQYDHVLLVGEGDFSFSMSLARKTKPELLVATCFDSEEELRRKYDDVGRTLRSLQRLGLPNGLQEDSLIEGRSPGTTSDVTVEWRGFSSSPTPSLSPDPTSDTNDELFRDGHNPGHITSAYVAYTSIDATKLSTAHKKKLGRHGPFSKIVFNFPHVGGLSTDVTRQVRANQQLLVGFFNAAKPLLSGPNNQIRAPHKSTDDETYATDDSASLDTLPSDTKSSLRKGQILVTIFEGEPYSLWNIRDLARHCGLLVVESFRFPWEEYLGYTHARTIGDITSGKDRSEEGKRKGKWRGEERDARSFVLEVKDDMESGTSNGSKRKRKRGDEDSGDE